MDLWEKISASIRAHVFGWSKTRWADLPIREADRRFSRLMTSQIGGRYRAEAPIFGRCFRAVDEKQGTLVILKVLPDESGGRQLLGHEFEVCSRLSSKAIVRYHNILHENGFTILVAPYHDVSEFQVVTGPPVEASLSRDAVGLSVFHQLQDGLDYLHDRGVIHSGLARDSVVVDRQGTVMIVNLLYSSDIRRNAKTPPVENHERLMYGSPEHLTGELTPESDYFSAGILIFEYLLRRHPFWRMGLRDAFEKIRSGGIDAFLVDPRLYNVDRDILRSLFSPLPVERRRGWDLLRSMKARR